MKRFALLLLAAALSTGSGSRAEPALAHSPAVDSQVIRSDQAFLEGVNHGSAVAPAPVPPAPEVRSEPPRIARATPSPAAHKQPVVVAATEPASALRPEPVAVPKESKVARVAPKPKTTPVPDPRIANRDRTDRSETVTTVVEEAREDAPREETRAERRDRERDEDDSAEVEHSRLHQAIHRFFHRLNPF